MSEEEIESIICWLEQMANPEEARVNLSELHQRGLIGQTRFEQAMSKLADKYFRLKNPDRRLEL